MDVKHRFVKHIYEAEGGVKKKDLIVHSYS